MSKIQVLVVDDEPMARAGIRMLLQNEEDIDIVAEAADGEDALTKARALRPDVIIMDVRMPGTTDGVKATRAVVKEGLTTQHDRPIRVIILTTFNLDEYIYEALQAGASGFLLKRAIPEEIAAAIRSVADGGGWLDAEVAGKLIDRFKAQPEQPQMSTSAQMDELTNREREVLVLLAQGMTNTDVAAKLGISEATVRTHLNRVMAKLHVREKAQAVIAAYQHGLVSAAASQSNSSP